MGTRGAFGYRINGADKITYNHFDSYPDGLGASVVADLRGFMRSDAGIADLIGMADALVLVDKMSTPTPEQVKQCLEFADRGVSSGSTSEWYVLLRETQPSGNGILPGLRAGFMIDSNSFVYDSLWCEYAYIVNLDEMTFEVYKGFQDKPHTDGRYASGPVKTSAHGSAYYPVRLVGTFPLADIGSWHKTWAEQCFPRDEEDEEAA